MPSEEEIDAGVAVVVPALQALIKQLPSIPFVDLKGQASAKLASPEGQQWIRDMVTSVEVADEHVRAGKQPPTPKLAEPHFFGDFIHGTDIPDRPDPPRGK
jgi:hypothetical protein